MAQDSRFHELNRNTTPQRKLWSKQSQASPFHPWLHLSTRGFSGGRVTTMKVLGTLGERAFSPQSRLHCSP